MGVAEKWRSGVATDAGRIRDDNEDRFYVNDDRGVFAVVDGVGGHAAGETAAELAVNVLGDCLSGQEASGTTARDRVRSAITAANNEIYEQGVANGALRGMACVLTVALIEGDHVTVGHVGDSRLYLIWNGSLRKLTSDHSPVGEREDRGELSEKEAMEHPRRHEVFRDVGSYPRAENDEDFVEIKELSFKSDAALLLCSDGLTDLLTASELSAIIEQYDGDAVQTAADLVEAANEAGGSDNITAVFVAGSEFVGSASPEMSEARGRHAVTRDRPGIEKARRTVFAGRVAFLIYGLLLGLLLALGLLMVRIR